MSTTNSKTDIGTSNPLEYVSIIQDLQRFRGSARAEGDYYDFPNQIFFKILFHFQNNSDAIAGGPNALSNSCTDVNQDTATGFLDPTWLHFGNTDQNTNPITEAQKDLESLWSYNTAWSYLVLNNEKLRAQNLQSFIEMLSNINSNTPWYFQNIKGLDQAINREMIGTSDFAFKPERDKISIECLPDAYDQRISTLLDLYRSIVWSWEMKREIVPSNLRKFDMTIIAFQMPIKGLNAPRGRMQLSETIMRNATKIIETNEGYAVIYDAEKLGSNVKLTSYKAWEFHGCEFDYNSTKSTFETISNAEGTSIQPQIDIYYDDCYEIRFNEFLGRHITDLMGDSETFSVGDDCNPTSDHSTNEENRTSSEINEVSQSNISTYEDPNPSWLEQAASGLMSWGETKLKSIYLGNLSGLSISKISQQLGELDDLGATVDAIQQYAQGSFNGNRDRELSDIFPENSNNEKLQRIKSLGNLYSAKTRANS